MDASYEPQDADRDAARSRSAPAFCQPRPARLQPARPVDRPKPAPVPPETVAVLPKSVPQYGTPASRTLTETAPPSRNTFASSDHDSDETSVRIRWSDDDREEETAESDDDFTPAALWTSLARGVSLVLGTLLAAELFREGGLHVSGPWWLDTRPLPVGVAAGLLGLNAAFLILFAAAGRLPGVLRGFGMFCIGLLIAVPLKNVTIYYGLLQRGDLHAGPSVAFGLHVVASLGVVLLAMRNRQRSPGVAGLFLALVGASAAALSFPVAQIACTGSIDARRPASAAIVFGPRPFERDAEQRIVDRIATAAELHTEGLVPAIVLTGSSHERLEAMRRAAIEAGVPADAIEVLDEADPRVAIGQFDNRYPKVNAREAVLLAVSDADHLPRLTIEGRRAGVKLFSVPSYTSGRVSPEVLFCEIGELWRSYLRR